MRVRSGKTVTGQPVRRGDCHTDDAPMGDAVGGIRNRRRCQRQMKDEWFQGLDLQCRLLPMIMITN
ncbi:hypothetical protein D3C87_1993660 [compost metagenome]